MKARAGIPLSVAVLCGLSAQGCTTEPATLTARVERRDFVNQITVEGLLRAVDVTVVGAPTQLERPARIAWLIDDGSVVGEGDIVARFDPVELEHQLDDGRAELDRTEHRIRKSEADAQARSEQLDTTRAVAELEASLAERYQLEDEDVFSRVEIIESSIDGELAEERKRHATEMQVVEKNLQKTESELLEIERRKVGLEVDRAEDALEALDVRAPHDGIASLSRDWRGEPIRVGDQVWRGQTIAEIPDLGTMEAELFVLEADAGALEVGRPAVVVVESRPDLEIPGQIKSVEAVAKPRFRGSPVQYVGVVVRLDYTDPAFMKPGQRVSATLTLDERQEVLQVPRQAVFLEDGASWVRVLDGPLTRNTGEKRKVEILTQSVSRVVIASGVEEGEIVLLESPEQSPAEGDSRTQAQPGPAMPGGSMGS